MIYAKGHRMQLRIHNRLDREAAFQDYELCELLQLFLRFSPPHGSKEVIPERNGTR